MHENKKGSETILIGANIAPLAVRPVQWERSSDATDTESHYKIRSDSHPTINRLHFRGFLYTVSAVIAKCEMISKITFRLSLAISPEKRTAPLHTLYSKQVAEINYDDVVDDDQLDCII